MAACARLMPLRAFRKDPFYALMVVRGMDLTGHALAFAVRMMPDQPGNALIQLVTTSTKGTAGIRLVRVDWDDGVPTSVVEIIALKSTVSGLPAAPEIGADLVLYYDLQWLPLDDASGLAAVETTVLYGPFIVKGSANG